MGVPLVSILIPCRNAAPWIDHALRSALGQTWPAVEVIVVDDGSGDDSRLRAEKYASPRCRVLRQEKRGAAAARNLAASVAQGDYFQYLDADDVLAPDKIERQMCAHVDGDSAVLSFGSVVHFFDTPERGERHLHLAETMESATTPAAFLAELWGGTHPAGMIQTGQWLVPRTLVEQAGGWNEALSVDDDGEFFARVVLASSRRVAVPAAISYYRKFRGGGNLAARATTREGRRSALMAAEKKSELLLNHTDDVRSRRAVRRLITAEIVAAWPSWPELAEEGMAFLQARALALFSPLEGSPWFCRLYPWVGWKMTRRLQWTWSAWRERSAPRRFTAQAGPWAEEAPPAAEHSAAHCSRPRATRRLPA